jgi:hypothetical protein
VNGFVPEQRWFAMRARVKSNISDYPLYREFVENDKGISAPMRQVVEEILSEIDAGI